MPDFINSAWNPISLLITLLVLHCKVILWHYSAFIIYLFSLSCGVLHASLPMGLGLSNEAIAGLKPWSINNFNLITVSKIHIHYSCFHVAFTCTRHTGPKQQHIGERVQTEASPERFSVSWGRLILLHRDCRPDLWPSLNPGRHLHRPHYFRHLRKWNLGARRRLLVENKANDTVAFFCRTFFWGLIYFVLPLKLCRLLCPFFASFGRLKFIRNSILSMTALGMTPNIKKILQMSLIPVIKIVVSKQDNWFITE